MCRVIANDFLRYLETTQHLTCFSFDFKNSQHCCLHLCQVDEPEMFCVDLTINDCSFVLDWFPSPFFCDVKERVSVRGLGGIMRQKTKTGKICHISERAKSNATE